MKSRIAQFAGLILTALVAGVFWGTWFGLSRSIPEISPAAFLEIGHAMIRNLAGPMSVLLPAAVVASLIALLYAIRRGPAAAFFAQGAAVLLLFGVLCVTVMINVPIDDRIAAWTPETLPPDWEFYRNRWERYHTLRTFAALGALAAACAAAVLLNREEIPIRRPHTRPLPAPI